MTDVIEKLKQLPGAGLTEVCEKRTFECYRMLDDGCMQSVTVVIFDAGPNAAGAPRYFGYATSAEGRTVMASADASLDAMLASIRWTELDPDPDPEKEALRAEQARAEKAAAEPESASASGKAELDRRDLFGMLRGAKKP